MRNHDDDTGWPIARFIIFVAVAIAALDGHERVVKLEARVAALEAKP